MIGSKMKYLILSICLTIISCSEEGEGVPFVFPMLKIANSEGMNLLNPSNESSYDKTQISARFISESGSTGELQIIAGKFNYKDPENHYLLIGFNRRQYTSIDGEVFPLVIALNEAESDTLYWEIGEKNGMEYTIALNNKSNSIVHKDASDNFFTWIIE
jgi:hypothetical protein